MTSPTPQSERRRAARALGTFPVRLSPRPTDAPAVLRDISEIGLACNSPEELPEMTKVALNFSLPGATEVHHVQGAVVRCDKLKSAAPSRGGPRWDLAIYFTEITPVTRAAIRNYVAKAKPAR
ncbi:MAG: PilZ domain-containing protein [Planctomycetes bacterium]|nr:PilZ domain-containing protein [Planctomycetota bacterium]